MIREKFLQLSRCPQDREAAEMPDGKVAHWTHSARMLFGYDNDEAAGRQLALLIVPTDRRDEERHCFEKALETGACSYESGSDCI